MSLPRMKNGAAASVLGLAVVLAFPPARPAYADAFTITAPLSGRAITSCSDIVMSGGSVDSTGINSPSPTNSGNVATNGNLTLSGSSTIHGDATVGPGKKITKSGTASVTGVSSVATSTFDCNPVDLVALKTMLQTTNDNARIPQTRQHHNPLTGASHTDFVMSGSDTLAIPAGTYYFTSFAVSGSCVITTTGPVHILVTGAVSMSGTASMSGGNLAGAATPYNLHLWISGTSFALSSGTVKGIVYAPSAAASLSSATLIGNLFANTVTMSGSAHVTRLIDDVPPSIAITSPANGSAAADPAHVVVTGTVSDDQTDVSVSVNGHAATIAADGTWTVTLDLSAGGSPATVTAVATDLGGNTTPATISVVTAPPAISLTSPLPNALLAAHVVNLSGGAGTATALTVNGTPAAISGGLWTLNAFDLGSDGAHTLTITGTNAVGGTTISPVLTTDTTPPVVNTTVAPPPNAAGWNKTAPTITFTCADATSGVATCPAAIIVSAETASQTVSGTATDKAGNQRTASAVVKVDLTPPVVAITGPAGTTVSSSSLSVSGTVGDALSGVGGVTCNGVVATITGGTFTCNVTLVAGDNTVTATATDVAGNTATAAAHYTLNADTQPPAITITSPANGAFTNDATVTVTGTATDDHAVANVTVNGQPAALTAGIWSATLTFSPVNNVLDGPKTIMAVATDTSGNQSAATGAVIIDTTPPVVTIDAQTDPRTTVYDPHVTVSGTVTDALSGVAGVSCDAVPATITGSAFQCAVTLPMGPHDVAVVAVDGAGNSTTATRTYTLAADTVPPLIQAFPSQPVTAAGWTNQNVTVSFLCADGETAIASCSSPVNLTAEGAGQMVTGTAVDTAGNTASATVTISIDKTPPVLAVDTLPAAPTLLATATLTGSVFDALSGLNSVTCNGVTSPVIGGHFSCTVAVLPGLNNIVVEAVDLAGNRSSVTAQVSVDITPPSVAIAAPSSTLVTEASSVMVSGTATDDDQVASVTVNGVTATLSGDPAAPTFSTLVSLTQGVNALTVVASDRAGNSSTASVSVNRIAVPSISIGQPADLLVTSNPTIDVSGTVSDAAATVRVNEVTATVTGNSFLAPGVTLAQGRTVLTALATSANALSATTSVNIYRDSIPPRVTLRYPADGAVVTQTPITVTGMVDDIVVGTINAGQVKVTVNGTPAVVQNRAFVAAGISLTPGANTLVVTAVDQGNNTTAVTSHVTYDSGSSANRLTVLSGDGQTGTIGTALPSPLIVQLTNGAGTPLAGQGVRFRVVENNSSLAAGTASGRDVTVLTNAQGQASVAWTLGTRAGAGNQRVALSAPGVTSSAEVVAIGTPGSPSLAVVDSGSNQFGAIGAELSRPIVTVVVDRGSNRLANVQVTFTVIQGGGSFAGQPAATVTTDSDGRAIVRPTLGPDAGNDNNVFMATADGVTGTATFLASGLVPGNPAATTIAGVVLDNSDLPIPGVTVQVDGTTLVTQTDAQGLFTLAGVPVGYVKLFVDGSTAQRSGTWPTLEYAMYTVPGEQNTLGMPIYLLPIDVTHGLFVDETHGGTLTLPSLPGFALTVAAGSATFPGGSRTGTVSVTLVHADKMPMPPGFGQQPRFIVTIQPPGVHFDPPAAMALPNVDGLAPGEITEMYSFDHDLGQFVAIGTGSVSEDASVINSDPGVGILKGGWHCGGNPATSGTSSNCGICALCNGTTCQPNPATQGHTCADDGNPCTEDICSGGNCAHIPIQVHVGNPSDPFTQNQYVDHDDQTRTFLDAQPLIYGQPLYASTTQHIGDMVRWNAYIVNVAMRSHVRSYKWSAATTAGATTPTTIDGPTSESWQIFNLDWKPGTYQITLVVTFDTSCVVTVATTQTVGIRTEDYILYGQVKDLPEDTSSVSAGTLAKWTCPQAFPLALEGTELGGFNDPTAAAYVPETSADRVYVTAHLLNLSADFDPPFPTDLNHPYQPPPTPDPPALMPPIAPLVFGLSGSTGYRQAVHAQFKYLVGADGSIMGVQRVGQVFALPGSTPAPCAPEDIALFANSIGVPAPRNDTVEMAPDGKSFAYIMSVQGGEQINAGNHELLRRELTWVFFRFRFNAQDGFVHSNWTHSTDSWTGDDDYDFSAVPVFWLYRRVFDGGLYNAPLEPSFPIYPDLAKFLRIAPRWEGAPPTAPSYPP